jgi:hypothetical protein
MARPRTADPNLIGFNTKLTPRGKAYLDALAKMVRKPAYSVLEDDFWHYWKDLSEEELPKDKRELVASFADATLGGESEPE